MKKNNKKGFTLAELLIVVAIIAVLVAISIPVFTSQLEKARESTDAANIRSAYAEVVVKAIDDNATSFTKTVSLKQQTDGWATADARNNLVTICGASSRVVGSPTKGGTAVVAWVGTTGSGSSTANVDGHATINFS